jgi:hypothetical protein
MSYTISASASYHWIVAIEARPSSEGVLKLILKGADFMPDQNNDAEIVIFLDNQPLVDRLVEAINGTEPDS